MEFVGPQPVQPHEYHDALSLLFQHEAGADRQHRIIITLDMLQRGELDPNGLFVIRGGDSVVGVLLCAVSPGAVGLLWPPQSSDPIHGGDLEDRLLEHGCSWLRSQDMKLGQAILAPEEASLGASLRRNGIELVTQLRYLEFPLPGPRLPQRSTRLEYSTHDKAPELFRRTLLESYVDSLDCPEIEGVRPIEDIVEGHRAHGRYDSENWWLVKRDNDPVGVVILADLPEEEGVDLAYVGIVPRHRGNGYAREIMYRIIARAGNIGLRQVTLSVDERNHPAKALYSSLGFRTSEIRDVYLTIWG